jgi:hypothetical protein
MSAPSAWPLRCRVIVKTFAAAATIRSLCRSRLSHEVSPPPVVRMGRQLYAIDSASRRLDRG